MVGVVGDDVSLLGVVGGVCSGDAGLGEVVPEEGGEVTFWVSSASKKKKESFEIYIYFILCICRIPSGRGEETLSVDSERGADDVEYSSAGF